MALARLKSQEVSLVLTKALLISSSSTVPEIRNIGVSLDDL